jgi:hypothetical protein
MPNEELLTGYCGVRGKLARYGYAVVIGTFFRLSACWSLLVEFRGLGNFGICFGFASAAGGRISESRGLPLLPGCATPAGKRATKIMSRG